MFNTYWGAVSSFWETYRRQISTIVKAMINAGTTGYVMNQIASNTPLPYMTAVVCFGITIAARWPGNYFPKMELQGVEGYKKVKLLTKTSMWTAGVFSFVYNWFSLTSFTSSPIIDVIAIIPSLIALESFRNSNVQQAYTNVGYIIRVFRIEKDINRKAFIKTVSLSLIGSFARGIFFYYVINAAFNKLGFVGNVSIVISCVGSLATFSANLLTRTASVYARQEPLLKVLMHRRGKYSPYRVAVVAPCTTYEVLSALAGMVKVNSDTLISWGANSYVGLSVGLVISISNAYNHWHANVYPAFDRVTKVVGDEDDEVSLAPVDSSYQQGSYQSESMFGPGIA